MADESVSSFEESNDVYDKIRSIIFERISGLVSNQLSDLDIDKSVQSAVSDVLRYGVISDTFDSFVRKSVDDEVKRVIEEKKKQLLAALESRRSIIENAVQNVFTDRISRMDELIVNMSEEILKYGTMQR